MRTFETAKKDDGTADKSRFVEFELDGQRCVAVRPKTALMVEFADLAEAPPLEQIQGMVDFMSDILTEETLVHFNARLHDADDDFDLDDVADVMKGLLEEFSARPTTQRSASSAARKRTGSRSTARSRSKVSTPEPSTSKDS